MLYEYLSQQSIEGTYIINVPADARVGRTAREALVMVRRARVQIQRPDKLNGSDYPSSVSLYAVEALEINPPADTQPIHWRSFPTHTIVCLEQALKVIEWYGWRWRIEQLFAILKKAGLNIEATQLESVAAIKKLTVLALSIALRVLQMVEGRENPDLPASLSFSQLQQQCLSELSSTLEGTTRKQQNPYPRASLPWATWCIARLGGWSGYSSQRLPGMLTLVRGFRQFESIFLGWKLAQPLAHKL